MATSSNPVLSALSNLAARLAHNVVDISVELADEKAALKDILKVRSSLRDDNSIPRHRNILVIGAGASTNVNSKILPAGLAVKHIKKKFEKKYGGQIFNLIEDELNKLSRISRLNKEEFETVLFACSKFIKKDVISELGELYNYKYPVSLFYEIAAHLLKHRFIDVIINFNFDEILDNSIEDELAYCDYKRIYSDGDCPETENMDRELLINKRLKIPVYIKPHGTISHPSSLRFTREDYFNIPPRISETIKFLLDAKFQDEPLPINMIIVGFGMRSFEFNEILINSLREKRNNKSMIFLVNTHEQNKSIKDHMCAEEKVLAGEKEWPNETLVLNNTLNDSFSFLNIKTTNDEHDQNLTLNELFSKLWLDLSNEFNKEYRLKDISRHQLYDVLFSDTTGANPVSEKTIKLFKDYLYNRIYLEIGIEILSNQYVISLHQFSQSRVGKYFLLLKLADEENPNLYTFIDKMGLKKYKGFVHDTFYYGNKHEKIITDRSEKFSSVRDLLMENFTVDLRNRLSQQKSMQLKLDEYLQKISAANLCYNVTPKFKDSYLTVFRDIRHEHILNTDIKWIYEYRRFFSEPEVNKWNLLLVVTESGSPLKQHLEILKHKKIEPIFASYAFQKQEERINSLLQTFNDIRHRFLSIKDNIPEIHLLPWRSHNQHLALFVNVYKDDAGQPTCILHGGIYFTSRFLSKKVNPMVIAKSDYDLNRLLEIYLNYWDRVLNKDSSGVKTHSEFEKLKMSLLKKYFENVKSKDI